MKLKKILAVALAATTALSSGVAYDMLGASTSYAQGTEKDDTFTYTDKTNKNYFVTYTYTVLTEAPDKVATGGEVKLSGVEFEDQNDYDGNHAFTINTIAYPEGVTSYHYRVKEVELDGSSFSDLDKVTHIYLQNDDASNLKSLTLKNFEDDNNNIDFLSTATSGSATAVAATNLETLDVSNSGTRISNVVKFISSSQSKLETLKIKGLTKNVETTTNGNTTVKSPDDTLNLSAFTGLKTVDVSDNEALLSLTVSRGTYNNATTDTSTKVYPMTLNINGDTNLTYLNVKGNYRKGIDALNGDKKGGNKGVSFITDESEEGSRNVDLSAYDIKELYINGAGIESLVLPGSATKAYVNDNFLTSLDPSPAADLVTLDASNNMLMEMEVGGLSEMTSLNLNDNFLTALDVSNCDKLTNGAVAQRNFIPKDNFVKASSGQSGVSTGDQRAVDNNGDYKVYMSLTGDAGLKNNNGANSTGIVKIGGTATANVMFKINNVPEGFAEKFASTITWKEANENGGAITLGEPSVVKADESYEGKGNSYNKSNATVVIAAPITGSDVKAAQEKITITAGNVKNTLGVQADNAILVTYDTVTNLPANKVSDENGDIKNDYTFYAPQQAAILPSSGTASVKLDAVGVKSVFDGLAGIKLDSWNTAADGTGTSYKFSGIGSGKTAKLTEDTALTAIYKEYTYGISFDTGNYYTSQGGKKSGSAPASMKNMNWGDETALSANGWTSTVKYGSNSNDTNDNAFIAWISNDTKNPTKAYEDGATVFGKTVDAAKNKKDTAKLKALWSNGNYSITLDNTSITLARHDQDKNFYKIDDLGVTIEAYDDSIKKLDKDMTAYSVDTGIVNVSNGYLFAEGEGTTTVYVYDQANGVVSPVAVTVTKDGAAATEDNTAKLQAGEKVKADNGQTVKLNSDGKTVTVSKGKNQKKVTVNTVVIDGVTYKVTAIAANAFKGMSKVQTVVIGNNVKTIGKLAFANCKNLKKVTMGKNVNKIGAKAFKNDKKLAKVLIKSKKLTTNAKVGSQAFKSTKSGIKFYIAKKAATFKKIKKVIKKKGQPTKAKYVKKYA